MWDAADALGDTATADWAAAAFTTLAEHYDETFHLYGDTPQDRLGLCHGAARRPRRHRRLRPPRQNYRPPPHSNTASSTTSPTTSPPTPLSAWPARPPQRPAEAPSPPSSPATRKLPVPKLACLRTTLNRQQAPPDLRPTQRTGAPPRTIKPAPRQPRPTIGCYARTQRFPITAGVDDWSAMGH
ncbi:hypothetical protein LT493_04370 [Streptomyces tricolor]|nr:hypothetical protein [Streptomyces tricolor]